MRSCLRSQNASENSLQGHNRGRLLYTSQQPKTDFFFSLNANDTLLLTSINTESSAAYRQDFGSRLSTKICEKC